MAGAMATIPVRVPESPHTRGLCLLNAISAHAAST